MALSDPAPDSPDGRIGPDEEAVISKVSWRDVWPTFRVNLVEETARCLADQQTWATGGRMPGWDALSAEEQHNLAENIARIFLAQDQAAHNLLGVPDEGED
jgi:hypothetical protein